MDREAAKQKEPLLDMNIQEGKDYDAQEKFMHHSGGVDNNKFYSFDDKDRLQRTLFQRSFGAMDQGSMRGSIFTLCSVTVGSGVLALPYVFA